MPRPCSQTQRWAESWHTPWYMWLPAEVGADGETSGPPPEVAEEAPPRNNLLLPLARRVMGAVTFWAASCTAFLREEDREGGDEPEVMVRFISWSWTCRRRH